MKQLGKMIGLLLLLAALGVTAWYFVSPLLLNRTVDEASPFPTATVGFLASKGKAVSQFPAEDEIGVIMPPAATITEEIAIEEVSEEEASEEEVAAEKAPTAEVVAETVEAAAPAKPPIVVGQGQFVDGDTFHKGSGVATLYEAPDSSYLLRFDDFTSTNGPDLHVLLSPNAAPNDHASLGQYLDLGALKGNIGDQNYTLPADFDPSQYKSVVIYCLPFQVIFATAALE
jgi:hypothetical protein